MKDRSLEDINPIKLLVCALSFIIVCMALILFMLLPVLKDFKENSARENSQIAMLEATKAKFSASEGRVLVLRNENNKSLEQFEQKFNAKNLETFLQKTFKNVKIKENALLKQEKYLKHSLSISANMENPKKLYDFIDALKEADYAIKLDYPLNLRVAKEGIDIDFVIKIYSVL